MNVELCRDTLHFSQLAGEWDALLERSAQRNVFLTWGWLYAWWIEFGADRELAILLARDGGGALVGIAPLLVAREGRSPTLRTVRFLGTEKVSSDYLDLIAESGREEEVAVALWETLRRRPFDWDHVVLTDMLETALPMRLWKPRAEREGFWVDDRHAQRCPYFPLAATPEAFRKSLGPSMRRSVRRRIQRLEEAGVRFVTTEDPAGLPGALDRFYTLHRMRWRTRRRGGNFQDPRVLRFHTQLVELLGPHGHMRLYSLEAGSRAVASLYALQYKDVLYGYQAGFDPTPPDPSVPLTKYSPGVVVIARSMEDGIRRGLTEFDFLRGPEPYKYEWTRSERETRSLGLAPPDRPAARFLLARGRLVRRAKDIVKRIIRNRGGQP